MDAPDEAIVREGQAGYEHLHRDGLAGFHVYVLGRVPREVDEELLPRDEQVLQYRGRRGVLLCPDQLVVVVAELR